MREVIYNNNYKLSIKAFTLFKYILSKWFIGFIPNALIKSFLAYVISSISSNKIKPFAAS